MLDAVVGGGSAKSLEMDLIRTGRESRRLIVNGRLLDYARDGKVRLLLTAEDVTETRLAERVRDEILRHKEALLVEQEIMLREVHHRIGNSLQIVSSMLLQTAAQSLSEETQGHLYAASSRIISIAAVQQQLSWSSDGAVEVRSYLAQLCRSISASLIRDDAITLDVIADDSLVDGDAMLSLGLIVTELIINALKHAFPEGRKGAVRIEYRSEGLGWSLSVLDDGVGLPVGRNGAKAGLGSSIVEAHAKKLGARLETANANPGTCFSVNFVVPVAVEGSSLPAELLMPLVEGDVTPQATLALLPIELIVPLIDADPEAMAPDRLGGLPIELLLPLIEAPKPATLAAIPDVEGRAAEHAEHTLENKSFEVLTDLDRPGLPCVQQDTGRRADVIENLVSGVSTLETCLRSLLELRPEGIRIGQAAISRFLTGYAADAKTQTKALRLLQISFFKEEHGSIISELVQKAIVKRLLVLTLARQ
ncbi:sensor histidine kinase [Hansschlegelia sp. KR7-227]|uniref:sensor histidine kinase n=1 Tax=Hansschlegelia sp. KR7-227 TaxID=3400914 RepID=UPI003BFB53F4